MTTIVCEIFVSPLGEIVLGDFKGRLVLCDWACRSNRILIYNRLCRKFSASFQRGNTPLLEKVVCQVEEYFQGDRKEFSLPLTLDGTRFQSAVWHQVRHISYGQRLTYAEISQNLNLFGSEEKIKRALSACPISIIVPTHRAIGDDNNLNDFAGIGQTSNLLRCLESPSIRHQKNDDLKALGNSGSSQLVN